MEKTKILKYIIRDKKTMKIEEVHYRHSEALDAVILLKYLNPGKDYFIDVVEKKFSNTIF